MSKVEEQLESLKENRILINKQCDDQKFQIEKMQNERNNLINENENLRIEI